MVWFEANILQQEVQAPLKDMSHSWGGVGGIYAFLSLVFEILGS